MKRKYTRRDFEYVVDYLREHVPGISIATDIICGFPTGVCVCVDGSGSDLFLFLCMGLISDVCVWMCVWMGLIIDVCVWMGLITDVCVCGWV